MKSFVTILAGVALAQGQCVPAVTVTESNVVTVTVQPSSDASPSAIVTPPTTEESKPSPYYPIGNNSTIANGTYPTHTPQAPTTLQTLVTEAESSSSSRKKATQTLFVVPTPVDDAPSASQATAVATSQDAVPAKSSPVASAAPAAVEGTTTTSSAAGSVKGEASFYGGNLEGGACSFSGYTIPSGLFGTAFGGSWDASQCGACVEVTNSAGKSIKAMVVDQCPECAASKLDLFENAFTEIGTKSDGIIPISYSIIPCDITSPLILKNKEGTSSHWFSMQVRNANVAVSKLEVSTDGGSSWQSTTRQSYNYFENSSGFGTESVDVRVTGINGKSVVVKSVSVAASSTKTASGNF